jgi:L-threonate 2-dehydrogenase
MAASDFTPEGRARQTLKDVDLMLEQAGRIGQDLPLLEVHRDILAGCVTAGEGDLDNSVVINEIRRRSVK